MDDTGELVGDIGELVDDTGELVGDTGEPVGDTGELVDDTGELVGDTGEPVGDTGELVDDTGELVGDTGELVGDTGDSSAAACQISEWYDYHNLQILRLQDFTRFGGKTSYCLMNRGPGSLALLTKVGPPYMWTTSSAGSPRYLHRAG